MFRLAQSVKHLNHAAHKLAKRKAELEKKRCSNQSDGITLPSQFISGDIYAATCTTLVPHNQADSRLLSALWAFCSSDAFTGGAKKIDKEIFLKVTNATLLKVPFDLDHWTKVAEEKYPNGLPKPYSDDPTQWIFHGHPCGSVIWDEEKKWTAHGPLRTDDTVLQVAVARLLGYRWPAELDANMELADEQREWVKRCEALAALRR